MADNYEAFLEKLSSISRRMNDGKRSDRKRPVILGSFEELLMLVIIFRRERSYVKTAAIMNVCSTTVISRLTALRLAGIDLPPTNKIQPKRGVISPDDAIATYFLSAGGMSRDDIAAHLGISYSAVRYRVELGKTIHLRLSKTARLSANMWLDKEPRQLTNAEACLLHLYDLSRAHTSRWPSFNIPSDGSIKVPFSRTPSAKSITGSPAASCVDIGHR